MGTLVLVPGAWLGSWCWEKLLPYLHTEQHDVYTPTLTGLRERSDLARPDIDLSTHIQDVINILVNENLWNVVLVGHSYAGMVVTGVADRVPERLAHLVYLDAIVPHSGQALFDLYSPEGREAIEQETQIGGDGWRWPIPDDLESSASLHGMSEADKRWFYSKAVAHPLKTFSQPVQLTNPATAQIPHVYILCTAERTQFPDYVEKARTDPNWRFRELPTGHWPMISMPAELAKLLLELM